jgi:hypothetical protein
MLISELTVYDFLKEKLKLSDSDAKRYAKELAEAEEKLHKEIENGIYDGLKKNDYSTKYDLFAVKADIDLKIAQLETKIEKGFKEVIVWVVGAMVAIQGLAIAIMKLF